MTQILPPELSDEVSRLLLLSVFSFCVATLLTPLYTELAYRYKFWKKIRKESTTGEKAKILNKLHGEKHKRHIPTMAGVIFVVSILLTTVLFNLSKEQTLLPMIALAGAGLVGLIDDIINIRGLGGGVAGLSSRAKFLLVSAVGLLGGWYCYSVLGYDSLILTFIGEITIGWLLIPAFAFVLVATANAVNISDGLDGLAGGLATNAFLAFGVIALLQGNYGIAGFCMAVVGALMSYVWFNIFPARFMMGDVGSFALGAALAIVAMLTDTVALLPVIGIIFVVEAGSSFLQILSKKIRKKKLFAIAPIHHNFEQKGWPETKVTMRFWVLGQIAAVIGVVLALTGGHI